MSQQSSNPKALDAGQIRTTRPHLVVPRTQTSMTFAVVGPSNRNKLPQSLRDLSRISSDQFCKHLKTSLFVSEDVDPGRERL